MLDMWRDDVFRVVCLGLTEGDACKCSGRDRDAVLGEAPCDL